MRCRTTISLTMWQCGERLWRAGFATKDDPDHVVGDLDPLDEGADDVASQRPVRRLQAVVHHFGEHAQCRAGRTTSMPRPPHRSRAFCRITRQPRSSTSAAGSAVSSAAAAGPSARAAQPARPSTHGWHKRAAAVNGSSRASRPASIKTGLRSAPPFAYPAAAARPMGRSTVSSR